MAAARGYVARPVTPSRQGGQQHAHSSARPILPLLLVVVVALLSSLTTAAAFVFRPVPLSSSASVRPWRAPSSSASAATTSSGEGGAGSEGARDPVAEAKRHRQAMARQRRRQRQRQQDQQLAEGEPAAVSAAAAPAGASLPRAPPPSPASSSSRIVPSQVFLSRAGGIKVSDVASPLEAAAAATAAAPATEEDEGGDVIVLAPPPRAATEGAAAADGSSSSSTRQKKKRNKKKAAAAAPAPPVAVAAGSSSSSSSSQRPPLAARTANANAAGGSSASSASSSRSPQQQQQWLQQAKPRPKSSFFRTHGDLPNVLWRAVSWRDLRRHPSFDALPPPSTLAPVPDPGQERTYTAVVATPADLSLFRQDSWQWDALHLGRLTTSRVGGLLGFHEPQSAQILRVPRSLTSTAKATAARAHLLQPAPACYVEFINALHITYNESGRGGHDDDEGDDHDGNDNEAVWVPHRNPRTAAAQKFLYQYAPPPPGPRKRRGGHHQYGSAGGIRLRWGSTQEATSILAAVNFFGREGARVQEAGLYPLEAVYPSHEDLVAAFPILARPHPGADSDEEDGALRPLPPMGASPDGVIVWPDGTIEALEAKNHSPFRDNYAAQRGNHRKRAAGGGGGSSGRGRIGDGSGGKGSSGGSGSGEREKGRGRFLIADQGPHSEIGPWHVAQLCWHMLCLGPQCRSAVFISNSATKGAALLRLRRDDEYMGRMLRFISLFIHRYLPPPSAVAQAKGKGKGGSVKLPPLDLDFFLNGPREWNTKQERAEYRAFLQDTLRLAASAELVVRLRNDEIQRHPHNGAFFLDDHEDEEEEEDGSEEEDEEAEEP